MLLVWIGSGILAGFPLTLVDLAMLATEGLAFLLCAGALCGAGLLLALRSRGGVYLMLVAALGVAVLLVVQPFLVDAAGRMGIPEDLREDIGLPRTGWWLASLTPALGMLIAGLLGLGASGREASQ